MQKKDFARILSAKSGYTIKDCEAIITALRPAIVEMCKEENEVTLGGIKIQSYVSEPCVRKNPATGEDVQVPSRMRLKVKPVGSLKNEVIDNYANKE